MAEERENQIGTIEHTRKMLAFLETLDRPSEAVQGMIRQYRAEVAGWEYQHHGINAAREVLGLEPLGWGGGGR